MKKSLIAVALAATAVLSVSNVFAASGIVIWVSMRKLTLKRQMIRHLPFHSLLSLILARQQSLLQP